MVLYGCKRFEFTFLVNNLDGYEKCGGFIVS